MLTEDNVREALRACFDPELHTEIVALGLVQTIELAHDPDAPGSGIAGVPERQRLRLELLPVSEDETYRAQLLAVVGNRLAGMPELSRVEVLLAEEPVWTEERVAPEARRRTGAEHVRKPLFRILNNRVG